MVDRPGSASVDEYIAGFPPAVRAALEEIRAVIRAASPDATETISYGIPTFDLHGRHLVHFGGFAAHIGFYPVPSGIEAFEDELKPFKAGKGTARFPLDRPLPVDLMRRIVEFRADENLRKATA